MTREHDELAAARRRLPRVAFEKDYVFEGPDGEASLLDLFEGRRQLIVYHFMFEPGAPGWPDAGCPGCSMFVDHISHLAHLHARDTSLVLVSPAPLEKIEAYRERMGWKVPWYSLAGNDFNGDCGRHDRLRPQRLPARRRRRLSHLLHAGRGVEALGSSWTFLDLTPLGRQEAWEDSPEGPRRTPRYEWWRRHDEYDEIEGAA